MTPPPPRLHQFGAELPRRTLTCISDRKCTIRSSLSLLTTAPIHHMGRGGALEQGNICFIISCFHGGC